MALGLAVVVFVIGGVRVPVAEIRIEPVARIEIVALVLPVDVFEVVILPVEVFEMGGVPVFVVDALEVRVELEERETVVEAVELALDLDVGVILPVIGAVRVLRADPLMLGLTVEVLELLMLFVALGDAVIVLEGGALRVGLEV